MEGVSQNIFAFGQTGSGKTLTLFGELSSSGLMSKEGFCWYLLQETVNY